MAVGIVAEFNPFHNGHKYLLETVKSNTNECVAVIMSGAFIQRGGIAITDKLTRTRFALNNGADLVLELPVPFSHNTAQRFAMGAIGTLKGCGIIDTIAFGSECADITKLKTAAEILAYETPEVSLKIKELMSKGVPYPVARQEAYGGLFDTSLLSTPNDILAIEYLRASIVLDAGFNALAIERTGVGHDSDITDKNIASATEIRRRIMAKSDFKEFMPYHDFDVYDPSRLDTAIISKLRLTTPDKLSNTSEVAEGLENKFIDVARNVSTVEELCTAVKSKRYTLSRIRRIAYSSLINLTKDISDMSPTYIRVLGANDNGRMLLRDMKEKATLPIITKPADYKGDVIFIINSQAEDIFSLASLNPSKRRAGNDIRLTPLMTERSRI